ncbi:metallophosphoesterase family protein [Fredinandcohnia sp. 179-A 10B2 NHS]|uniref:metallophosphoesterase family protein n=1 Tax=Fredinandcohnia sp. 179-A 10B2 NHS TaxID=3235176 RepID=UPI0039A0F589
MKALLISDSHGWTDELVKIKERHKNEVDFMLHCGDSELPSVSSEMSGFSAVRGNCDFDSSYPEDSVVLLNGKKVLLTHGHLYNVKMTLMNLKYRAQETGANIVCFGHSHIAGAELIEKTLFINPGSIRLPRMRKEGTYVILTIIENKIEVTFFSTEGKVIDKLTTRVSLG